MKIFGSVLSTLTNEQLLELINTDSYMVIHEGTTRFSPLLIDYGTDAVSYTKLIDPDTAMHFISEGATCRQIIKYSPACCDKSMVA